MGCYHSTPAPTDETLYVQHKPPPSVLCRSLKMNKGYTFCVPKDVWNTKYDKSPKSLVKELQLDIVPIDNSRCLIKENNGTVVAVLLAGRRLVRICSFMPPSSNDGGQLATSTMSEISETMMNYEGRQLYEWAIVQTHYKNGTQTSQYEIKTNFVSCNFVTNYFGSRFSARKKIVIERYNPHRQNNSKNARRQQQNLCASLEELQKTNSGYWKCCSCPGIDPVMIVCLAISLDKIQSMFQQEIRNVSHDLSNQRISNIL